MQLRALEKRDLPLMLEWMRDKEYLAYFREETLSRGDSEVEAFIDNAAKLDGNARHFAIASDKDEYIGTVSLKNIDEQKRCAEYAIVLRKGFFGAGASEFATAAVIDYAFDVLGLNYVYLNVRETNARAIAFYNRFGFTRVNTPPAAAEADASGLLWFTYSRGRRSMKLVKTFEFTARGDERGHLVVIEGEKDVPFDIKRLFYIFGSDRDVVRGQHANRLSSFVIVNVAGTAKVLVDDGAEQKVFELNKPHIGLYLPPMMWKEMYDFSEDSVMLVLSDKAYDSGEYIRDKATYLSEIGEAQ